MRKKLIVASTTIAGPVVQGWPQVKRAIRKYADDLNIDNSDVYIWAGVASEGGRMARSAGWNPLGLSECFIDADYEKPYGVSDKGGDVDVRGRGTASVDSFKERLAAVVADVGAEEIVFTLISSNYAHHFSFPLAAACLEKSSCPKKYVVNIDYHIDYGTGDCNVLRNSYWGQWVTSPRYGIDGCKYVAVANVMTMPQQEANIRLRHKMTVEYSLNTYPKAGRLGTLLGSPGGDTAYYITVDRDFMKGNGTKYDSARAYCNRPPNPNTVCHKNGLHLVRDVIREIVRPGGQIVGFDVCGLPDSYQRPVGDLDTASREWDKWVKAATQEIQYYAEELMSSFTL
jgi:hypothetical protein